MMGKKKEKLINMDKDVFPHNLLNQFRHCCDKMKKAQTAIFKRLAPNLNDVEHDFASLARSFDRGFLPDYSAMCWQYSAKCHRMLKNDLMEIECLLNAARMYLKANDNVFVKGFITHEFEDAAAECYHEAMKVLDKDPETNKVIKACIIREMVNRNYSTDGVTSDFESPVHRYWDLEQQAKHLIFRKDYFSALEKLTDIYDNITERKVEDLYHDLMARNEITRLLLLLLLEYPKNRLAPSNVKLLEKYTWGESENLKSFPISNDIDFTLTDEDIEKTRAALETSGIKNRGIKEFEGDPDISDSTIDIDWIQEAKKIDDIFLDFKIESPPKLSPKSCRKAKKASEKTSPDDTLVEEDQAQNTETLDEIENKSDPIEDFDRELDSPEDSKIVVQEYPEAQETKENFEIGSASNSCDDPVEFYVKLPETGNRLPCPYTFGEHESFEDVDESVPYDNNDLTDIEKYLLEKHNDADGNRKTWSTLVRYPELDHRNVIARKVEELVIANQNNRKCSSGDQPKDSLNTEEDIPGFTDDGYPIIVRDNFVRAVMMDEGKSVEDIERALENLHKGDITKKKAKDEARKAEKLARKQATKKEKKASDVLELSENHYDNGESSEKNSSAKPKLTGTKKKISKPIKLGDHPLKKEVPEVVDEDLRLCLEVLTYGVKLGQGDVIGEAYNRIYRHFNEAFISDEQDFLLERILKRYQEIRM